jgi:hypothetical protein
MNFQLRSRSVRIASDALSAACLLAVVAGVSSCGSSALTAPDGGGGGAAGSSADTSGAPATASAFCSQYRQQDSAYSARCYGGAAADWKANGETYLACARFDTFVTAGTVRYHKELAAACLKTDAVDRSCFAPPSRCFTQTLEGTLTPQAPCTNDYECPANAACWAPQELGFNACAQSTCFAVADKVGDPCTPIPTVNASLCFPGVVSCAQGVCAAYAAAGQACGDTLPACAAGLHCDTASAQCVAIVAGGPCAQDFDCLGTEYCAGTTCSPRIAIGLACDVALGGCVAFAVCNPSGVCEAASHLGQRCGSSSQGTSFLCVDSVCQPDANGDPRCVAPLANGAACTAGAECASQGCGTDGTCAACAP